MDHVSEIDQLVYDARFGTAGQQTASRQEIRSRAAAAGIRLASIRPLYTARATGDVKGFSVPAMNVRGMPYEFCRAIIRAARATKTGAFIVEIARSEIEYTDQRPDEVAVILLAAALREGHTGPLFLQGDHYKVKAGTHMSEDIRVIEQLIDESLAAGFYNIDIDASTTVDLRQATVLEQQRVNSETTAHLTTYIRERQPVDVAIGGEIGEIGGVVSTADDLRSFMTVYREALGQQSGIGKIAIQTGTSHGGTPTADGKVAPVRLDLDAVRTLGTIARKEFGLAGVVQHGASTLPADGFEVFPDAECAEVHLSTEFQNIIMSHPTLPQRLRDEMQAYLVEHFQTQRTQDMTDAQFYYKMRKHVWGPFKRQFADLPVPTRDLIGATLEAKVGSLFRQLRVENTRSLVDQHLS